MIFYDCTYIYIYQETHKTQQDECQVLKWYYHIIPCKKQWVFSHNVSQQASAPPQKYIVSQVRNEEKLSWKSKQHKTHLAKEKACAKNRIQPKTVDYDLSSTYRAGKRSSAPGTPSFALIIDKQWILRHVGFGVELYNLYNTLCKDIFVIIFPNWLVWLENPP